MKAILRTQPGEVALVDRPTPEPGPGEVLIRIRACGLCGSDLARLRDPDEKWNRVVLGHECMGVVEAVGSPLGGAGVHAPPVGAALAPPAAAAHLPGGASAAPTGETRTPVPPGTVSVGARVALLPLLPDFTCPYCARGEFSLCDRYSFFGSRQDGGLAEYLVVPATNVLPLPDEVDDESAAMLEPLSVATKACLLAGLSPRPSRNGRGAGVCAGGVGPSALIMGAGAIGLLAVQVALALGASPVIACDVIPEKLALAASLGAETVLLPSPSATSDYRLPTTDFCLECSGHHAAFSPALDSLAKGGTLVLVGTGPGEVTLSGAQREQLCRRMITIRGQWMSYGPTWPGEPWTVPLALLAAGRLDPRRLITHRFPLAQTPEAVRFMLTPGADYLKVMVTDT